MSEGEVLDPIKELMEPWSPGQLFSKNCTEEQSRVSLSTHTTKKKATAPGGGGGSTRL